MRCFQTCWLMVVVGSWSTTGHAQSAAPTPRYPLIQSPARGAVPLSGAVGLERLASLEVADDASTPIEGSGISSTGGSGCVGCQNGTGHQPFNGTLWDPSANYTCGGASSGASGIVGGVPCGCPNWYVGLNGLIMTRDDENPAFFSYSDEDESIQLLNSREASMDWGGGVEFRLGRPFCGCEYGLEAVYWGLFPGTQESNLLQSQDINPGFFLNSTLNFDQLDYDPGSGALDAGNWFDSAERHRLRRHYEYQNVEVNLIQQPLFVSGYSPCGMNTACCGRNGISLGWLFGLRYFRSDEYLQFATDRGDEVFGNNPDDEMFYDIDVENNLFGAQVGGQLRYALTQRLHFNSATKFGLYGNHISHQSFIGGANGAAIVNNGPNAGRAFDVRSSKNDVSFAGEINLGGVYRLHPQWNLSAGYRAMAVTGLALPTEQIYPDLRGIDDLYDIDSNGSLILHGAYAGLEYLW